MAVQIPAADIITNANNSDGIIAGIGDVIIINPDILISAQGNSSDGISGTTNTHIEIDGQVQSALTNGLT